MSEARRGELWLVDFGAPVGHEQGLVRPALIISADEWNRHASTLTVLPLTRTSHGFPTRIELEATEESGLDETSYARCEDIRSISERRLLHALGRADATAMNAVAITLRRFLEM